MSNSSEDRVSPRPLGMRQLRPLLPADEEVAAKLAGGGAGGTASDAPGGTQKRVAVACEACRRRKAKVRKRAIREHSPLPAFPHIQPSPS